MDDDEYQRFRQRHAKLISRLCRTADISRWGVPEDVFARALHLSASHRFGASAADAAGLTPYLESLHLEDLALACACREGRDAAWEFFVATYRQDLRRAGRAVAGDTDGAELADSLYADLYGLEERDGERRSLFLYFHGRSKLSTWLRAILAQRHVDIVRSRRRMEPIEEAEAAGKLAGEVTSVEPDPDRSRLGALVREALVSALASLDARQRLRLACYYVQQLTLAQIGRLIGEHEATVSRKLDRARRDLRAQVERILREDHRLTDPEVVSCLEYARDESTLDLSKILTGLTQAAPGPPIAGEGEPAESGAVQDPGPPPF